MFFFFRRRLTFAAYQLREEEVSNGAQHCLLLSKCSVASILLHDSYRLEEEKIDNFLQ
jgi:hypothetical protein